MEVWLAVTQLSTCPEFLGVTTPMHSPGHSLLHLPPQTRTEGLVTVKGRVAAELNVGHDELVLTELLLGGAFADISPDALAALCSCFVWSERSTAPPK